MDNSTNSNKQIKTVFKELLGEFINLLMGNVWNKIGLSILLLVLALVCIFSPIVDTNDMPMDKPVSFYIFGGIFIVVSIFLIARRWKELKGNKNS